MKGPIVILAVVLLLAGVSQADILMDFGYRQEPNAPETDGRYWNAAPRFYGGSVWTQPSSDTYNTPIGELVDSTGALSGSYCYAIDIPGTSGKNGPADPNYPARVTYDWWNGQSTADPNAAGIKITGLAAGTYEMNIWVGYPCDLMWTDGAGKYTVQGQVQTFVDTPSPPDVWDPVLMNFPGLVPVGGEIVLWMESLPGARTPLPAYNAIMMMELIPEPATLSLLALGGLAFIRRRR